MRLVRSSLTVYRLPYPRPVHWKDTVEDGCTFMLLRLHGDGGAEGVAEAPIKPTWTGTSPRALAAVLEDMLLPALAQVDLGDASAVRRALAPFPENGLAKGMVDTACWDLRANARGEPLWKLLGGTPQVALSWTVTRAAPKAMAEEAAAMVAAHGFRTLKVKGGQGFDTDRSALREIRAAVGDAVSLYVDANCAYPAAQAAEYIRLLAEAGSTHAEDPCVLRPDRWFEDLQRASPLPLLVDTGCQSVDDAQLFLERGARAIGMKPVRVGASIALDVARCADAAGASATVGLHAESALGSLAGSLVASAFPARAGSPPAETSYFLSYAAQVVHEVPAIRDGILTFGPQAGLASLIDWRAVERHRI